MDYVKPADVAKAMDYMLKRWTAFTCFLDDGRICISNNAAERALRGMPSEERPGYSPVPSAEATAPQSRTHLFRPHYAVRGIMRFMPQAA